MEKEWSPFSITMRMVTEGAGTHEIHSKEVKQMNPILAAIQAVYGDTKEVSETKDALKAAQMMQEGNWAIVDGCIQGKEVVWILVRFR